MPKASIDDRYRDTPYYLAPEDKVGQEAFAVIRDAMKKKKMVGIARVVMARRERVMMLEPFGKGIMGTTLHYPYEIRSDEAVFEEIPEMKLPDQMVGLGRGHHRQDDRRVRAGQVRGPLRERDDRAHPLQAGGIAGAEGEAASRPANVVNLMDALRRSIEDGAGKRAPRLTQERPLKPRPRSAPRRQPGLMAGQGQQRAQAHRVRCRDLARARPPRRQHEDAAGAGRRGVSRSAEEASPADDAERDAAGERPLASGQRSDAAAAKAHFLTALTERPVAFGRAVAKARVARGR